MSPFMTMVMVRRLPLEVVDGAPGSVEVASLDVGGSAGGSATEAGELDDASDDRGSGEVRVGSESVVSVDELHPASATTATDAASHRIHRGGRPGERPRIEGTATFRSVIEVKHRIRGASVTRRLRPGR
jgi:hypothetical protein